ncbi:MAG: ribonuclease Z [Crocinitomicaceae bacterium]|nr:ribonuclease Z [Crocinitomicaceae bacterium]
MSFEVTILGSGGALPTLNRNSSAQYVNCSNKHLLIDCGEGTQMQMRKFGVHFQRLDIILISHLHGDHFFGLVGLLSTMRLLGRDGKLTIICPKGLPEIIRQQLEVGYGKLDFDIHYIELTGKEHQLVYEDKSIEILCFPLKHKIPTNGFLIKEKLKERKMKKDLLDHPLLKVEYIHRLKKGEDVIAENGTVLKSNYFTEEPAQPLSYAYCSDTAYAEKIVDCIKNATVLYHEATFLEQHKDLAKITQHSTSKQAATIAKMAGVKTLYMGHLSARYDETTSFINEAKEIFDNVFYVEDGMKIIVQ